MQLLYKSVQLCVCVCGACVFILVDTTGTIHVCLVPFVGPTLVSLQKYTPQNVGNTFFISTCQFLCPSPNSDPHLNV